MPLELTRNRLSNLAMYEGEITIEGEHQNEIVIRIPFGEHDEGAGGAESAYNALLDIVDDRCDGCGRYAPESLKGGLCWRCQKEAERAEIEAAFSAAEKALEEMKAGYNKQVSA